MRAHSALAILLALAGCAASPVTEMAPEPPAVAGAADPGRSAVLAASYVFADPARVAGRPAEAARAAAELEWMAASLPGDPRWIPATPALFPQLRTARASLRQTLGVAPAAPAPEVVRALLDASAALESGSRTGAAAALTPVAPGGGEAVLARLDRMPPVPGAGPATALAREELLRLGRDDPD